MAAFRAPSIETHATGTPGGICAIESSASSPSATLLLEAPTVAHASSAASSTSSQRASLPSSDQMLAMAGREYRAITDSILEVAHEGTRKQGSAPVSCPATEGHRPAQGSAPRGS